MGLKVTLSTELRKSTRKSPKKFFFEEIQNQTEIGTKNSMSINLFSKNKSSYYFRTYELLEMIQMFSRLLKILRLIRYAKKYYYRIGWEARLAGRPDWLGGQISWEARLVGRQDWIIPYPPLSQ